MEIEIERKYLVKIEDWEKVDKGEGLKCIQAYLMADKNKAIRVRTIGKKALLTIKGATKNLSRSEYEYEIPYADGIAMLKEFGAKTIAKTRYYILHQNKTWEVDVFEELNKGLIIAEIELKSETEFFEKPAWIGKEVSLDSKYINACLQDHPYCDW